MSVTSVYIKLIIVQTIIQLNLNISDALPKDTESLFKQ